jgi:diadenosine tetraphosphate (Ap4A) HIT family hydrolase
MDCLGCRIANGTESGVNIVYEDERITCVLDIDPFNEGHTLKTRDNLIRAIRKISSNQP